MSTRVLLSLCLIGVSASPTALAAAIVAVPEPVAYIYPRISAFNEYIGQLKLVGQSNCSLTTQKFHNLKSPISTIQEQVRPAPYSSWSYQKKISKVGETDIYTLSIQKTASQTSGSSQYSCTLKKKTVRDVVCPQIFCPAVVLDEEQVKHGCQVSYGPTPVNEQGCQVGCPLAAISCPLNPVPQPSDQPSGPGPVAL